MTTFSCLALRRCDRQQLWRTGLIGLVMLVGCESATSPERAAPLTSPGGAATSAFRFESSSGLAQVDVRFHNGEEAGQNAIIELMGGGVALCDYDRDGRLDLCFPDGGTFGDRTLQGLPHRLVRQVAPDRFTEVGQLAGMAASSRYSHGCSAADVNNDGFTDLLMTGYGGLTLWINLGDGTFVDMTDEARLNDDQWSTSAAWCDANNDGLLDLYVAHYVNWSFDNHPTCIGPDGSPDVCPPRQFDGLDDTLYVANGDGTFRDATQSAGLSPAGKGLGVTASDLDHDGDMDIYVANDTVPNFFYVNDGQGHFHEDALTAGLALDDMSNPNGSMGLAITDADADGLPDIFVTNYEDELFALYQNLGGGLFQYVSRKVGLNRLGTLFVGFGCVAGDFDADGDEDIAIANGHVVHHPVNAPIREEPLLLANEGHKRFERVPAATLGGYFAQGMVSRGLATGDLDRDGRLDLIFTNIYDPAMLLYNRSGSARKARGLHVQLAGRRSNRDAIGAWAELETSAGVQLRQLVGGGSYLSTSELALNWQWGDDVTPRQLTVHWPSGTVSVLNLADATGQALLERGRGLFVEPMTADAEMQVLPLP